MKRLNKPMSAVICIALSLLMLVGASAATSKEMYENGVVSDGDVSFGDVRDGIVSDVSEGGNIMNGDGDISSGDIMSDNGTGSGIMEDMLEPDGSNAPDTTSAAGGETTTAAPDGEETGGMGVGIIIAVIVVIAVIVIIFLLMPKRKG